MDELHPLVQAIDEGRLIQTQVPCRCGLCGTVAETRPYGPNGEEICYPCGRKDPKATEAKMAKALGH